MKHPRFGPSARHRVITACLLLFPMPAMLSCSKQPPRSSTAVPPTQAAPPQDAPESPAPVEQARAKDKRPHHDSPGEAAEFRLLQRLNADGSLPPNALMQAKLDRDAAIDNGGFDPRSGGISSAGWTWMGPGNIGGRIRSILIHPTTPATMWVGSVGGGVWKTTDAGANWLPLNDFLAALPIGCMALDPANPNTLYAGTGEGYGNSDSLPGAGILKSINGGTTWTQLAQTIPTNPDPTTDAWGYVNRIAIHPTNSQILLAGTRSTIFRSTDSGATWTSVLAARTFDIDFHPTDGSKCIAGGNDNTARYSTDGGQTWNAAAGIPSGTERVEVTYAPSNPNITFASVYRSSGELYRSVDGGQNYVLQNTGTNYLGSQGWYDNIVWVDPVNPDIVIVGGIDLWRSTNAGVTFSRISNWQNAPNSAHADHHMVVAHPGYNGGSNKTAYFGNDGGIYRATDARTVSGTNGWTALNNGLGITQFYGGAVNPTTGRTIGGTQDNGTLRYTGSTTWSTTFGGDGGFCGADPTNNNYFYGEYVRCTIFRSTNSAGSGSYIYANGPNPLADAVSGSANFISRFALDPNNPNRILACCANLWRSNNVKAATPDWFNIKPTVGSNHSAVSVAMGRPNIIWVGHNNGRVYRTANGLSTAPTWTRVDSGTPLPDRFVTQIAINPANTSQVYVAFSGYAADCLWRTDNNGTAWTQVTGPAPGQAGSLPRAPVNSVVLHPSIPGWVYAGTDVGVYASINSGTNWSTTNDGPANVDVEELMWRNTRLIAVTHGRGMYYADIDLSGVDCNTNSIADATEISGGMPDCNTNAVLDICERAARFGATCDGNQTLDVCEAGYTDCNSNGVADACERQTTPALDCNTNNSLDVCETGGDCDNNGVLDVCQITGNDCNTNGQLDACELANNDCDGNSTLDPCDTGAVDCNTNGLPDSCDMAGNAPAADACAAAPRTTSGFRYRGNTDSAGSDGSDQCMQAGATSPDVWYSYIPAASGDATISLCGTTFDSILSIHPACPGDAGNQIACNDDFCGAGGGSQLTLGVTSGTEYKLRIAGWQTSATGDFEMRITGPLGQLPADCNTNGVLDVCETDCNSNGRPDACDIQQGTSPDSNGNGIPDECETPTCGTGCPGDLTADSLVDGADISQFVQCVVQGGGGCACADMNADSQITTADVPIFVTRLLAGVPCP